VQRPTVHHSGHQSAPQRTIAQQLPGNVPDEQKVAEAALKRGLRRRRKNAATKQFGGRIGTLLRAHFHGGRCQCVLRELRQEAGELVGSHGTAAGPLLLSGHEAIYCMSLLYELVKLLEI
jgi:hypothetical protein